MRATCEVEPTSQHHLVHGLAMNAAKQQEAACIRVLLVGEPTALRQQLRSLLRSRMEIQVVGEAHSNRDALPMVEQLRPDVVLMDTAFPAINGLSATRAIAQRLPGVPVIVLGSETLGDRLAAVIRAGAAGFLYRDADAEEVLLAIRAVARGNAYFGLEMPTRLARRGVSTSHAANVNLQPLPALAIESLDLAANYRAN